jgi:ABC-2 type transport system permease protein
MRVSSARRALLGGWGLAVRELKRFVRQRNRVFGALAQPALFWLLFGAGLSPSFRPSAGIDGLTYSEYFFPGTVILIVLFTAIFATISVIEDRNEGFLQGVLVSPLPTSALVGGKLAGATILALGQALLFLALAPFAGLRLTPATFALAVPLLTLVALGLSGVGFTIAWRMDSTQGFHAVMTAFLMPMGLLSGAFFPAEGVPAWLGWIIALNPLTYGLAAFRRLLYLHDAHAVADLPGLAPSLLVVVLFAVAAALAAHASVRQGGFRPSGARRGAPAPAASASPAP